MEKDENVDMVASLTGNKFTRAQIQAALAKCNQDPDDAIQQLIDAAAQEKMFSEKATSKSNLSVVMQGQQTKLKIAKSNPKPQKLKIIKQELQSQDYF